jgi:L-2,4-diaminobutyrate decarboxylase
VTEVNKQIEQEESQIDLALQRIEVAFNPDVFSQAGRGVTERLASYLSDAQQSSGAVLNWRDPKSNIDQARAIMSVGAVGAERDIAARVANLVETIVAHGQTLHDPRYIGHQVPPPIPVA